LTDFRKIPVYQFRGDSLGVSRGGRTNVQSDRKTVKMMKIIVADSKFSIVLARNEYPCSQGYWSLPSQHSR